MIPKGRARFVVSYLRRIRQKQKRVNMGKKGKPMSDWDVTSCECGCTDLSYDLFEEVDGSMHDTIDCPDCGKSLCYEE